MVFEPRLRFKAQPIEPEEPVHKVSLEFALFQYSPLFFKSLLLYTKIKQSFIAKLVHYLYIMYSIGSGPRFKSRLRLGVFESLDNIIYYI
jgi:hypothetical protein